MSLFRKPNSPYWWMDVSVAGRRIRKSTKRKSKADAKLVEAETVKRLLDRHQLGNLEEATLGELYEAYTQAKSSELRDWQTTDGHIRRFLGIDRKPSGSRDVTQESTRKVTPYAMRAHLSRDLPAADLTQRSLSKIVAARRSEGLSANTINGELRAVRAMLNWGKANGYLVPTDLEFPMEKTQPKLRYLLPGEEEKLLTELDPKRDVPGMPPYGERAEHQQAQLQDLYDLVVLLLDTGQRYSDIAQLPWSAVDTNNWQEISIYQEKTRKEVVVGMTSRVREILQRRWDNRVGWYVFPGWDGKQLLRDRPRGYTRRPIAQAIERAGLNAPHLVERYGRFTIHSLRDTFASRLVQRGASLYEVQQLLGHTGPQMTQKYAHLEKRGVGRKAALLLDSPGDPGTSHVGGLEAPEDGVAKVVPIDRRNG